MIIGIDASRANNEQKTGVEWYAFFLIQELKKLSRSERDPRLGRGEVVPPRTMRGGGRNWKLGGEEVVKIVLYSDKPLAGELAELPENWESRVLGWPPKRLWTQVRLSWEMLVRPPDILFIPAHVFPIVHPKKTIMTIHDVAALKFPESYSWFERWYSVWSARFAVKKLWKVITPSEFTKKELLKLEIGNPGKGSLWDWKLLDKLFVIAHGYNKNYRVIKDEDKIEKVLDRYKVRRPFLLTIGRLETKKNTINMVKAFNLFKKQNQSHQFPVSNFQFLLIGKPGHGYEQVQAAIEQSPYKQDIVTPGWVDEDDLPYLMNAAEVFVFPSLYEGFGLPVLEAMACGTPVVAARGMSLEEVGGEAAVYVDAADAAAIAAEIKRLCENEKLREEIIKKGLEQVKRFSWSGCAEKTWDVLTRGL
ncbi:MAG: glycosyltransferase family 1 protein [Patescibacteria group bacterium]